MSDTALDVGLSQPSRTPGRGTSRVVRLVAPLLVALGLIVLWEIYVKLGHVSHFLMPTPTAVFGNVFSEAHLILPGSWITVKEILEGYVIAAVGGVVLAIAIVAFRPVELTIYPILVGSQVIPKLALAPVILILFGEGHTSRIIIIVSLAFFPVVISTVVGLKSVEQVKFQLADSIGANPVQKFVKFRIPQSTPDMFGGLKLAATRAVGGAIVAEFITPGNGLGRLIQLTASELRPDISMACIVYLVLFGVILFFVVSAAERIVTPWHVSNRRGASW